VSGLSTLLFPKVYDALELWKQGFTISKPTPAATCTITRIPQLNAPLLCRLPLLDLFTNYAPYPIDSTNNCPRARRILLRLSYDRGVELAVCAESLFSKFSVDAGLAFEHGQGKV
jgi:hypothetical protein